MIKKFLLTTLFLFLLLIFPHKILAEGEFITDINVEYKVVSTGITHVKHNVSLENVMTNLYATSYNLLLENIEPANIKATYQGKEINTSVKTKGLNTEISINFDDAVVGKGKKRIFEITYENSHFAQRTGEVWEISIPKLSTKADFRTYSLTLNIPETFGQEAYISPKPRSIKKETDRRIYVFDRTDVLQTGITAGFGSFQVFSFTLNYHLENPITRPSFIEIAIPPDTNLQRVYYSSINPLPENIRLDNDGNWLAGYTLKSRERMDIQVDGSVQIFSGPRPFPKPTDDILSSYFKQTEYWHSQNAKINDLAVNYKTAKDIYSFVVNTLNYSYEKVSPQGKREGSLKALENPQEATCMEFTDLFIAIARAAGIPAREINGFAYTENPKIQPLSLVNDVLHSWPEFWDKDKEQWIQIDPTWASTTGGVDYFNKLDLRHFTFVIHGQDPVKPYTPGSYKLGPNPQKYVFVNFGRIPKKRNSTVTMTYKLLRNIPFTAIKYEIEIYNEGPTALYNLKASVFFDNNSVEEKNIEVLPPYGKTTFQLEIPYSLLGRNTPSKAEIFALNSQIELKTYKNRVITDSLFVLFFIIIFLIIALIIKLKPRIVLKICYRIKSLFKKNNTQTDIDKTDTSINNNDINSN